jgi:osmoprotectant transport system permease protein
LLEDFLTFVFDHKSQIVEQTLEHLWITMVSLFIATIVGILTGILISRYVRISKPVLSFVNIVQTIPSVALLGFLLPFFGIGVTPAIMALFLYALLPIVRNTYAGIKGVDSAVTEAARGLGMTNQQILTKVELPIATPVIFAGVRTAMVINIGVATLCALIAAGGLGEYIFRGIAVNNVYMILAGAVPASLLAIILDALLGLAQKNINHVLKPLLVTVGLVVIALMGYQYWPTNSTSAEDQFVAGFNPEFMEREDGYPGLQDAYDFSMDAVEMEIGLMYEALRSKKVDVISGFSTDGRVAAFDLRVLKDDKNYFPPYYAAPLAREDVLNQYPRLESIFEALGGQITEVAMMQMNDAVDRQKQAPSAVARRYLSNQGYQVVPKKSGDADLVVGSKNFTENFILAEMFAALIESESQLTVELRQGFGGTKLLMDAIKNGDVDMYPEYTGTALLVMLKPPSPVIDSLIQSPEKVYSYVKEECKKRFDLTWLSPLGFNNTTALMMREAHADSLGIRSISDLKTYINNLE